MPGIRALGAVQPVVEGGLALAFEGGVESLGSGVVLERRQKVVGHHHGGAAGVGGGPAPVAAWRQASLTFGALYCSCIDSYLRLFHEGYGHIWHSNLRQIRIQQRLHCICLQHIPAALEGFAVGLIGHPALERDKGGGVHGVHARHGAVGGHDDGRETG